MENVRETYNKSNETHNANNSSHYSLLTIGLVIAMIGVTVRFIGTIAFIDVIANVILIIGALICLKAVSNILK